MALNLYRRHFRSAGKCVGGHAPDSRNYEADELRRAWKKCHCPIYADGTLSEKFRRQNTKQTNWGEAKGISAAWEVAGRWGALPEPVTARSSEPTPKPKSDGPPTIEFATDAYLANRAGRKISDSTLRKFKTFVKQLREFAAAKGYFTIDQFDAVDMDEFYAGWRDGIRAKGKKLGRLKGFFKFCVRRKWIKENPADDLEAPVGAGTAANRIPLTDPELVRIYKACDELPDVEWKNHLGGGVWRGEDVKTIIMLFCWTGLRISDGATFDMSRVSPHADGGANIFLRMHKTKGALFSWIDDWLFDRLLSRELDFGSKIFACGRSERLGDVRRDQIPRFFGS